MYSMSFLYMYVHVKHIIVQKNHIKEQLLNEPVSPYFLSICWQLVDLEGFCSVVILQEAETKQNSIKQVKINSCTDIHYVQ